MNTFVPLWSQVVDSTLWEEELPVRVLFLTMMALKDPDHVIRMPFRRLCKKANMEPDVCERALKVLLEPDGKSIDHQNFEGRRIQAVDDGWLVLNGAHYQAEMQRLFLRMKKTQLQRKYRAEEKLLKSGQPLPGETAALKAEARGDQAAADRIAAAALPEVKAGESRGTLPEAAPAVVAPEITPEAADKMRAYLEEQRRQMEAREAAAAIAAREKLRPAPVPIPGPVGPPSGSPLGMGWAEQEVEVKRPGAAPVPAAPAPVKPAGPVDVRLAIHHPGKASGQG